MTGFIPTLKELFVIDQEFDPQEWLSLPVEEFIHILAHDARSLTSLVVGWTMLIAEDPNVKDILLEDTEYTIQDIMTLMLDSSNKLLVKLDVVEDYVKLVHEAGPGPDGSA